MKLETQRLFIRKASLQDAPFFLKLLNEESYIKNIRDSLVRSLEASEKFIQDFYLKSYETNGFGLYVLECKKAGTPLGVCGLVKRPELDFPDLGFALLSTEVGKGYIQESSQMILKYSRDDLKFSELGAITSKDNTRSANTLLKLGFIFQEEVQFPNQGKILDLYMKIL